MKTFILMLLFALCGTAEASSVHTCPASGPMAPTLRAGMDGSDSWTVYLPSGEVSTSVKGDTLYCNYDGIFITKVIGLKCVLGGNGGKITTQRGSSYCTSQGSIVGNKLDCFAVCE